MDRKFKSNIKEKNDNPTFGKMNKKPKGFDTTTETIKEKEFKTKK